MKHLEGIIQRGPGQDLYYQRWRPEQDAKAVVAIVHGFGEHSGRYANVVNSLVPAGYAVYSFDNRGHGKSFGKRGHIDGWEDFRTDVFAFLEMVREKEPERPLYLMGHSLGGLIALEFVLRLPDGLDGAIISGPALTQGAVSPVLLIASRLISMVWPGFALDTKLESNDISKDPQVVMAYQKDPLVHSMASARFGTEMGSAIKWVRKHAEDLQAPILIIHGGDDRLVDPKCSREFFENITLEDKTRIEYEGYFHETHNDLNWEKPVGDILDWLEKRVK
ncbi:MAG: lysophospholipase [Desulfatibacillum sp.]|nr:lysophospholipase [Desulfatibacillum sp.]